MAGVWNRLIPSEDGVPVHLLRAAIVLGREGIFSNAQILSGLNAVIGTPLDAASQTDLLDIKGQAQLGTAVEQVMYTEIFESLCLAVQLGLYTNEAGWRTQLGI